MPRRCALCRRPDRGLCSDCAGALPGAPAVPAPPGLDDCWALLDYDGATPRLVAELKYRNHRDALDALGRALAVYLHASRDPVSSVTWAPTSRSRRRARGFDQAELLARATAVHAAVPVARLLHRSKGGPQTGAGRLQRLTGPSFEPCATICGHVVVVDDVWTTGATLAAAAHALRRGGAERVSGLVLAVRS